MSIQNSFLSLLKAPSAKALWRLRAELLQAESFSTSPIWHVLDGYHRFLVDLSASVSAHEFSKLATLYDIGALGGVALENVLQSNLTGKEIFKRLLVGGASEGLMVLASRQYVQAFEVETAAVYESAAWQLHDELWRLSRRSQPDLQPKDQLHSIAQLLAPIKDKRTSSSDKALTISYLYQTLLLAHLKLILDQTTFEA